MDDRIEYSSAITMIDDGTGSNIAIPSILISEIEGMRLLEKIKEVKSNDKAELENYLLMKIEFSVL